MGKKGKQKNNNAIKIKPGITNQEFTTLQNTLKTCSLVFIRIVDQGTYPRLSDKGVDNNAVNDEIKACMSKLLDAITTLTEVLEQTIPKRISCNDIIFLFIRYYILFGDFSYISKNPAMGQRSYHTAMNLFIGHYNKFNFKDDLAFQLEMRRVFKVFFVAILEGCLDEQFTAEIYKIYQIFKSRCGDSFGKTSCLYDDFMRAITLNDHTLVMNSLQIYARNEFLIASRRAKFSFEKMQFNNKMDTQSQLYYLELLHHISRVSDLSHPRTVWGYEKINGNVILICKVSIFNDAADYLKQWIKLKKEYFIPSLAIFKKLKFDEINSSHGLHFGFCNIANEILQCFITTANLFNLWIFENANFLKSANQEEFPFKNVVDFMTNLGLQSQFLQDAIDSLMECLSLLNQRISVDEFTKIMNLFAACDEAKESICESLAAHENKGKKQIITAAKYENDLIELDKQRIKALENKLRINASQKKLVPKLQDKDESEDSTAEDDINLDKIVIINPALKELQDVDELALKLSQQLKLRSDRLLKFLNFRSRFTIALPQSLHVDILHKTNVILFDYYQFVSLYERHRLLSQKYNIQSDQSIQMGIRVSQDELKDHSKKIEANMTCVLKLTDEMIQKQKASKKQKIFQLGKNYVLEHNLMGLTEKQIMSIGKELFIEIGERKIANDEEFSEYTKQKEFLELIQLSFSGIEHLQHKIKPYLAEHINEALHEHGIFSFDHFNSKRAHMNNARFEGLLGLILKHQYAKSKDLSYLRESAVHFKNSRDEYGNEGNKVALIEIEKHLSEIEVILLEVDKLSSQIRLTI